MVFRLGRTVFSQPRVLWPLVAVELTLFAGVVLALTTHPQYNSERLPPFIDVV